MQIIHLPPLITILSCFIVWPGLQMIASIICHHVPPAWLDPANWLFRQRSWETSAFYRRRLLVNQWKKYLPDGAAIMGNGFKKKHLAGNEPAYLAKFLAESCRAELTHWLAILPFWLFGLYVPPFVLPWMLLYALVANLPCIITQRYNRPRVAALLQRVK